MDTFCKVRIKLFNFFSRINAKNERFLQFHFTYSIQISANLNCKQNKKFVSLIPSLIPDAFFTSTSEPVSTNGVYILHREVTKCRHRQVKPQDCGEFHFPHSSGISLEGKFRCLETEKSKEMDASENQSWFTDVLTRGLLMP